MGQCGQAGALWLWSRGTIWEDPMAAKTACEQRRAVRETFSRRRPQTCSSLLLPLYIHTPPLPPAVWYSAPCSHFPQGSVKGGGAQIWTELCPSLARASLPLHRLSHHAGMWACFMVPSSSSSDPALRVHRGGGRWLCRSGDGSRDKNGIPQEGGEVAFLAIFF